MLPTLLLALQTAAPQAGVQLPPSAAADTVAALDASLGAGRFVAAPWPAWDQPAWDTPVPWRRWVELVVEESRAPRPDAGRRGELALLAATQGRHLAAWEHFAATAAEPAVSAALLPRLFPGIPPEAEHPAAAPLPDNCLLRPVLPPLDREPIHGRPEVREAHYRGLAVGAAVCDVELSVEPDGVEVILTHTGGGPARVRLVLPVPREQRMRVVYVNWERQETVPEVIDLELLPGEDSEAAVWGRFDPRSILLPPSEPGQRPPAQLQRGGLELVADPGDPWVPRFEHLVRSLGDLLHVPTRLALREGAPKPEPGRPAPLRLGFPASLDPRVRDAKLSFLISAAEAQVLSAAQRR